MHLQIYSKNFLKHCLLFSSLFILSVLPACAPPLTTPYKELETIPAGKAILYIYRPSQANHPTMIGGNAKVVYKGETLAWFPYGGYYPLLVDPGEVEISTIYDSVTIDAKAGQTYFLRISSLMDTAGYDGNANFIGPVSYETAKEDLSYCQLFELKRP